MPRKWSARLLLIPILALVVAAVVWRLACPPIPPPPPDPPSPLTIADVLRVAPELDLRASPVVWHFGAIMGDDREGPDYDYGVYLNAATGDMGADAWAGVVLVEADKPATGFRAETKGKATEFGGLKFYGDPALVQKIRVALSRRPDGG